MRLYEDIKLEIERLKKIVNKSQRDMQDIRMLEKTYENLRHNSSNINC